MDKAEMQYEKRDSVEVTRNAKGEYGWKIKLYYNSDDEMVSELVWDLKETDRQLREAFLE
jgi:hypothetical protein